ncbi:hypothetical protein T03_2632 [Trichinella britovi]|uniref:Uncharacterized protein n=1 Tax=Trichinella britovi TaxID=45882 RepID=A0A0V1D2W9_TRIBR|nr:hypothetical protein T03_2632 [Trichinella britovi]
MIRHDKRERGRGRGRGDSSPVGQEEMRFTDEKRCRLTIIYPTKPPTPKNSSIYLGQKYANIKLDCQKLNKLNQSVGQWMLKMNLILSMEKNQHEKKMHTEKKKKEKEKEKSTTRHK